MFLAYNLLLRFKFFSRLNSLLSNFFAQKTLNALFNRNDNEANHRNNLLINMARGNQRDLARAKNLKKQQEDAKKKKKEGNKTQRMESDADAIRAKQQRKAEEAAAKAAK